MVSRGSTLSWPSLTGKWSPLRWPPSSPAQPVQLWRGKQMYLSHISKLLLLCSHTPAVSQPGSYFHLACGPPQIGAWWTRLRRLRVGIENSNLLATPWHQSRTLQSSLHGWRLSRRGKTEQHKYPDSWSALTALNMHTVGHHGVLAVWGLEGKLAKGDFATPGWASPDQSRSSQPMW